MTSQFYELAFGPIGGVREIVQGRDLDNGEICAVLERLFDCIDYLQEDIKELRREQEYLRFRVAK